MSLYDGHHDSQHRMLSRSSSLENHIQPPAELSGNAQMASPSQNSPMGVSSTASAAPTQSSTKASSGSDNATGQILTKPRLQELVREIDPTEQLDEEVEELLLQIADDFVENTVTAACLLAKHRKVSKVEVKDVQLHLERNWNMWIPGFGTDELRPYKRATVTEAHKQRLALIKKAIKKY
ncbi:transcription initiation factor TFIID subunit 12 isoform X3 [Phlebotomus argentipes]|uniref:transcription initiation factor TFIID subunit 12 isoform X3 n=1 Tax=Phlebotomus argentipes TaxID=94469 RepID=UPI002893234C|nr:transcription initiation factor TFIID subunit 12 isoform X3 [Phlebotomus argentipes]